VGAQRSKAARGEGLLRSGSCSLIPAWVALALLAGSQAALVPSPAPVPLMATGDAGPKPVRLFLRGGCNPYHSWGRESNRAQLLFPSPAISLFIISVSESNRSLLV